MQGEPRQRRCSAATINRRRPHAAVFSAGFVQTWQGERQSSLLDSVVGILRVALDDPSLLAAASDTINLS